MKTLYELIGALPEDDADELRAAFRRAVKARHPDFNPDDPEAPREFRRIVRANAILSDPRQREAYDRLLENARRQQRQRSKRGMLLAGARRLGVDAMVSAVASVVFIGGYLLLKPAERLPPAAAKTEMSRFEAAPPVAVQTTDLSSLDRAKPQAGTAGEKITDAQAAYVVAAMNHDREATDPREPIELASLAPEATVELASPLNDTAPKDENYFRRRGATAYHDGDFARALANFDLAIQQNKTCSDCYVDRGIVLHRMGDLKGAFADVNEARRLDALNRTHSDAPVH
jgi:curved DNA-binding protein CbpA